MPEQATINAATCRTYLQIMILSAVIVMLEHAKQASVDVESVINFSGTQLGGRRMGRAPPPAIHTLAKDMSLIRGATHFTFGLRPSFLLKIYLRPPLKITQLRPCLTRYPSSVYAPRLDFTVDLYHMLNRI